MSLETDPEELSYEHVSTFVRQLTHDLRNQLNGIELEGALLAESQSPEETKAAITRIRKQAREIADGLGSISQTFSEPEPMCIVLPVEEWMLMWQDVAREYDSEIDWPEVEAGKMKVEADPEILVRVFRTLLKNSQLFGVAGKMIATVGKEGKNVVFRLNEPKSDMVSPGAWGERPFVTTRRGAYGLGLWEARRLLDASSGEIQQSYDKSKKALVTTIRVPAA